MTFTELAEAVHRDCEAINPKAYSAAECSSGQHAYYDGTQRREVRFMVYHDNHLRPDLQATCYYGSTPDEVYEKFIAAVMAPNKPTYEEALSLCDTPEAVQS
jgi:hypothetical protein